MNLFSRLAYLARSQPSKVAVQGTKDSLTYSELHELACRIASLLRASGVVGCDIVGVRMRDTPAHLAALFAVMKIGALILPFDWRGTRAEFDRSADRYKPKAILGDNRRAGDWSAAMLDLADAFELPLDSEPVADAPDGVLGYSLTSGTTGQPKAIVVTHEQILARCATRGLEGMFTAGDRFLSTLPLAFPAGREHALCQLLLGATLVQFSAWFEPAELVDFVNEQGITAFNLSPNMSRALIAAKREGGLLMPGVRVMISTTGKLEPHERAALRRHVVPDLIDYYGSTGMGPVAVVTSEVDASDPSAVGRCTVGVELQIVDDGGQPASFGEVGQIRVRGPAVATRVIGAADDDEEGMRGAWYYPGDLGRLGPDGLLHLAGRAADLIKRGGLMIHAQEVEHALRRHAAIEDAAVIGVPSAELGQEVVAFIVADPAPDPKDVIRFCRGELAGYKVPSRIELTDALPRNAAGKVVKAELAKLV